jgi:hypothetical protein
LTDGLGGWRDRDCIRKKRKNRGEAENNSFTTHRITSFKDELQRSAKALYKPGNSPAQQSGSRSAIHFQVIAQNHRIYRSEAMADKANKSFNAYRFDR